MRTIEAGDLLSQDLSIDIPEGRYEHLLLRVSGTSAAAQTGTTSNLGRIRVNYNGTDIISSEFEFLHQWTNLFYGLPENTSAEAGACSFSSLIPFSNRIISNGLDIGEDDLCQFFLTRDSAIDTTYDALTYELLGVETMTPQNYIQMFYDLTRSYSGAAQDVFDLKHENIGLIALIDGTIATPTAILDRAMVTRDDEIVFNGAKNSLLFGADIFHEVEAASVGAICLDMAPGNDPLENLASSIGLQLSINALGTIGIWYLAYEFDADKFEKTVAQTIAKVARKISEKPPMRREAVAAIAEVRLGVAIASARAPTQSAATRRRTLGRPPTSRRSFRGGFGRGR